MENAGCRVVEFLERQMDPLERHSVVIFCGKGNNGGDGLVIARQLWTRYRMKALTVVLASAPEEFQGDAALNFRMASACGVPMVREWNPRPGQEVTLVVDALLGTGLKGPAQGSMLDWIRLINSGFPSAVKVCVDTPSGLHEQGVSVAVDYTVAFVAPKVEQVMPPTCDRIGRLTTVSIGAPAALLERNPDHWLATVEPASFRRVLMPRARGAHKGEFGHVLVIGGAQGKGGAAAMSGFAALRAGAGLVTVACAGSERPAVTALAPELMTQEISEDPGEKDVLALGPGLGRAPEMAALAQRLFAQSALPMVVDADGLNALAGTSFRGPGPFRVLTPHPGEMGRLVGISASGVQGERLAVARSFAQERNVALVLKGQRTLIAFPDGRVFVNPTGSPAMATAGSGDVLTGLIAGLLAQWPDRREEALLAAVWLHGRAGEIGAAQEGELCLTATGILRHLPAAVQEAA
jgi:NAD(P)H-hydrate epimerase